MDGSRGAVVPANCVTIELKDLADVIDFEDRGEAGEVYGFELTENGLYKRKEIDGRTKNPKFGFLRDVDVEGYKENINYFLRHVDKNWTLVPSLDIDWEVKFEFISPYTLVAKDFTFRKAINAGSLILSLISDPESRGKIAVKPFKKNRYIVHRKQNDGEQETILDFTPRINVSDSFTMIFDVIIRPNEASVSTRIMNGITFAWREIGDESIRVLIAIKKGKEDENVSAFATNEKLQILINKESLTHLEQINLTHLDLISFHYTDRVITQDEFQIYSKTIK